MNRNCLCLVAAVVVVVQATVTDRASAWNDRGHMLVAMIAYQELKPEVRERVDAILRDHPQRDQLIIGGPASGSDLDQWVFMKAATWPDLIRATTNPLHGAEHHARWHYINLPITFDGHDQPAPVETWDGATDPGNLVQAYRKVTAEVTEAGTAADRRAISLCWVEHLVGDIHQPLHATGLFSGQFPDGDKGGNSFGVRRGEKPTNLHSYWDDVLGSGIARSTLQAQFESLHADPELSRAKLLPEGKTADCADWAKESMLLAKSEAYRDGTLKGVKHTSGDYPADTPKLPSDYEERAKNVAAKRVVLAGYRLADVLNAAVAAPAPAPNLR